MAKGELMLRRKIADELNRWQRFIERKALLVTGSRQIGKSYSIREFGKSNYATYIELNLMERQGTLSSRREMPMISLAG